MQSRVLCRRSITDDGDGGVERSRARESDGAGGTAFGIVLWVKDVEVFGHQGVQLPVILVQVVEYRRHAALHFLEGVVTAAERLFSQQLPQPLDQVEVGRV